MPAPLRKLYSRAYVRLRKGTQDGWFVVIGKANRVLPASRSEGYKVILAKADQVVFNDTLFFGLDAGQIDSMSQALATLCERMLLKISEYSKFTKTFPATNALRAGSMTPWTWHLPPMSFRLQAGDLSVDSRVSMLDTAATEQGRFQRIAAFTSEMSIQVNRLGSIHAVPVVLERFAVPEFPQLLPKDKCVTQLDLLVKRWEEMDIWGDTAEQVGPPTSTSVMTKRTTEFIKKIRHLLRPHDDGQTTGKAGNASGASCQQSDQQSTATRDSTDVDIQRAVAEQEEIVQRHITSLREGAV